jgi:hypothetical protein
LVNSVVTAHSGGDAASVIARCHAVPNAVGRVAQTGAHRIEHVRAGNEVIEEQLRRLAWNGHQPDAGCRSATS